MSDQVKTYPSQPTGLVEATMAAQPLPRISKDGDGDTVIATVRRCLDVVKDHPLGLDTATYMHCYTDIYNLFTSMQWFPRPQTADRIDALVEVFGDYDVDGLGERQRRQLQLILRPLASWLKKTDLQVPDTLIEALHLEDS